MASKKYMCPYCGQMTGKIDQNVPPTDDGEYICECQSSNCDLDSQRWLVKKGGK